MDFILTKGFASPSGIPSSIKFIPGDRGELVVRQ